MAVLNAQKHGDIFARRTDAKGWIGLLGNISTC